MRSLNRLFCSLVIGLSLAVGTAEAKSVKVARKPNQSGERLSIKSIQNFVVVTKDNMKKERQFENRRRHLQSAYDVLNIEFEKGLKANDRTFFYVNALLLNIEYLLQNDCDKSKQLIQASTTGTDGSADAQKRNDQSIKEAMSLHAAYCANE